MTRKAAKIVMVVTVVIALALCLIILALLLNLQAFKPRIEAAASKALSMDVRVKGRLGIDLFPAFGISLQDISLRTGEAEVVTVERVRAELRLIPLARREVWMSRVVLTKPVFSIGRDGNGVLNIGEEPGRAALAGMAALGEISISQGRLVYTDRRSGEGIEVTGLDLTLRSTSPQAPDGMKPFRNIAFSGDIRCMTMRINQITLTNLVLRTAGEKGTYTATLAAMDVFGGTGKGSISVDVTGAVPRYRADSTLDRFRVGELIQALSPGEIPGDGMEGTADFTATLAATGKSADALMRSLSGDLFLKGENLILHSVDIDALITRYEQSQNFNILDVGAFFLIGPFGPVLTKGYDFGRLYKEMQGGKGVIREIVSAWKVNQGIAEATDVAFATARHRVAMKGGLNFTDDRFVDVTIAVLDEQGCAVYSQKVQGPFSKPQIEKVSIFRSLTGPLSSALANVWKFIRGEECKAFYTGSVAHPEG